MYETIPHVENNPEEHPIKEGVEFVFEQHPELETIGSKEQYSEYVNSIFPNTKIKDILWHVTEKDFDAFDNNFIKNGTHGAGIYFTERSRLASGDRKIASVVNVYNPILLNNRWENEKEYDDAMRTIGEKIFPYITPDESILQELEELRKKGDESFYFEIGKALFGVDPTDYKDFLERLNFENVSTYSEFIEKIISIIGYDGLVNYTENYPEYIIKSSAQTHILGSRADLEKFKEFIGNKD